MPPYRTGKNEPYRDNIPRTPPGSQSDSHSGSVVATQRPIPLRTKPLFDNCLLYQFNAVPLTSRDESEWYGPWNALLCRLFSTDDGFQVAPQHMLTNMRGAPEWTLYYIVKIHGFIITCVVEVKPYYTYEHPAMRVRAYEQLEARLQDCVNEDMLGHVDMIYGIQCIGHRFMIMKMNPCLSRAIPSLRKGGPITEVAPKRWWRHQATKKAGCRRLLRLVEDVKEAMHPFEPIENGPELELEDDPFDREDIPSDTE